MGRALPLPLPRRLPGSESGGGTGCGVPAPGGCRLRAAAAGLQDGQHPGQDGVAGEAPRLGVPGGEHG